MEQKFFNGVMATVAILSLIVAISVVLVSHSQFISERESELKILDSHIDSKVHSGYERNGKIVNTTEFIVSITVVNSVTARYPARILYVNDASYVINPDGKVISDLNEPDEFAIDPPHRGVLDWEEPHSTLVFPSEVYDEIRFSTEVFMYGNYTLVLKPDIAYYDPFTNTVKNCSIWLYKYKIEGEKSPLLLEGRF